MKVYILTYSGVIGSFHARMFDESMGVIGGELQVTDLYINQYQNLFRKHTLGSSDWDWIKSIGLAAITETGHALSPAGGICITDLEEVPDEIPVEVCGLSVEEVTLAMAG